MSFKKKIVIPIVLAVVVIAGTITGVTLASADDSVTTTDKTAINPQDTLVNKVAAILGIDEAKVQAAFTQAQDEIQTEQLDKQLANLVSQGKITQAQANAYKVWLSTKPDGTEFQNALKTWMDANPLSGSDVRLPGIIGGGKFPVGGRCGPGGLMR